MNNPKLYIIAGPNGAGKTTFVLRFLPYYANCINFVNADLIASGLSPFSPEVAAIKAGKLMLDEIDTFRKQRGSIVSILHLKELRRGSQEAVTTFRLRPCSADSKEDFTIYFISIAPWQIRGLYSITQRNCLAL